MQHYKSTSSLLVIASLLTGLGILTVPANAQTDISNSTKSFTVGIDASGTLYNPNTNTGFRRNGDGYDPLPPGTPRDSWGISANGFGGYADPQDYGVAHIVANGSPSFGSHGGSVSSFLVNGTSNLLRIDQTYSFAAANVLKINTMVTNISGSAQAVLFQRDVDWDIPPHIFSEITTADPLPGTFVSDAAYEGFQNPDPTVPYINSSGPAGGTFGPDDFGGGIKLDLGVLANGGSSRFNYFYAINNFGQLESSLRGEASALGATYLVSTRGDNPDRTYSALIGVQQVTPEGGSFWLIGTGFASLLSLHGIGRLRAYSRKQRW